MPNVTRIETSRQPSRKEPYQMNRLVAIASISLLSFALCSNAYADPDRRLVRIILDDETATVTAAGRTRVDVLYAVVQSLKETKRQCPTVTVGPWLQLPDIEPQDSKLPSLTVCIDDRIEGSKTSAYIAISKDVPIDAVFDLAEALGKCGFDDVRLLSDQTLREFLTEGG
jgi:hypothetical protein